MGRRPLVRRVRDPRLADSALLHLPRPGLRRQGHAHAIPGWRAERLPAAPCSLRSCRCSPFIPSASPTARSRSPTTSRCRWTRADAGHPGAQRRRQDDAVQPDLGRRALRCRPRRIRRPRHHGAEAAPALPRRHRPQLPGAAALRQHDGVREPGHRRLLRRPAAASARPGTARARCSKQTGLLAQANKPAGGLTLLNRKRLELARALATRPEAAAARRDRRRPDRA